PGAGPREDRRLLAREVVDHRRDRVPVPRDVRVHPRLPRTPRAPDLRGLRGSRGRDDRVLEQRALEHGEPVLLGEGAGAAPALHDGARVPDGDPLRHGARWDGHDDEPRDRDPDGGRSPLPRAPPARSRVSRVPPLPPHAGRGLRARHDPEQPLPPLGPRGLAHGHPLPGADPSPLRLLLPGAGARRGDGRSRVAPSDHPRAGRHPADPLREGGARTHPARLDPAAPGPAPRFLPLPGASVARAHGEPREAGRAAHAEGRMSPPGSDRPGTVRRQADVIAASAWLGWQIDANWADPFTFLVFSIAKPLATSLILYFM